MKDRRIKNYWWESIHQYKGELLPPYRPLSFPSFRGASPPVIASTAYFAMRGGLFIELPQQRKARLPRKRNHELAMTALGLRFFFAIPDIFPSLDSFPLSLDGRGSG